MKTFILYRGANLILVYGKTLAAGAIESTLNGMCILKMRSEAGKMNEF